MSERWNTCRLCRGKGSLLITSFDKKIPDQMRVDVLPCGRCNGEGSTGNMEDAPWCQPDELTPEERGEPWNWR